jgi:hypothetical protein
MLWHGGGGEVVCSGGGGEVVYLGGGGWCTTEFGYESRGGSADLHSQTHLQCARVFIIGKR